MKKLLFFTFFVGLFSIQTTFSQEQSPYRTHSNFFAGGQFGLTTSAADIKTYFNMAGGLNFGYTFLKYRPVEFDVRARYIFGSWRGQDLSKTNLSTYEGGIYSTEPTDYRTKKGFVFRNFDNMNQQLSLEAVVRFNIGKKRFFAPYLLGGIAGSFFGVWSNLLDKDEMYNYENISRNTYTEIRGLQDKSYETRILKHGKSLSANVGIGLSFNINDGLRVGAEHVMTFSGSDLFDGVKGSGSSFKNDVYQFTAIYAQFYLRGWIFKQPKNPGY